jgi:hypothetical protein
VAVERVETAARQAIAAPGRPDQVPGGARLEQRDRKQPTAGGRQPIDSPVKRLGIERPKSRNRSAVSPYGTRVAHPAKISLTVTRSPTWDARLSHQEDKNTIYFLSAFLFLTGGGFPEAPGPRISAAHRRIVLVVFPYLSAWLHQASAGMA